MPKRSSTPLIITLAVLVAAAIAIWLAGPAAMRWFGELHGR
jgi:hypothetical protein